MATAPMATKVCTMTRVRKGTSAMTTIHADELQPGDVVAYNGRSHRITRVHRRDGWAWPVAADDTGWAIALNHHLIDVHRPAA
jgi:hypothetical protein